MVRTSLGLAAAGSLMLPAISPAWSSLATFALAQGFAALGIAILLRAGQISFGHAFYFALGAYGVAFGGRLVSEATLLVAFGAMVAGLAAAALAPFISRYRGIFFAMLNLSLSMLAYTTLQKSYGLTGGSDGLRVPQVRYLA
jgi:branched-chain amino acid transport system permease protein